MKLVNDTIGFSPIRANPTEKRGRKARGLNQLWQGSPAAEAEKFFYFSLWHHHAPVLRIAELEK